MSTQTTAVAPHAPGECNGDRSPVNGKGNGPMTNAERQRRYRDKLRGSPPLGRWAGHTSRAAVAKGHKIGRTILFMSAWILEYAPDCAGPMEAGTAKATPTYRRLKAEYDIGLFKALGERPSDGATLHYRRENGEFVFEWIEE